MEKEIWKDVKGYEGEFQVSNFGRIKGIYSQTGGYKWRYVNEDKSK